MPQRSPSNDCGRTDVVNVEPVTATVAHLEATGTRSRAVYERFGFEVTTEISPTGGPPLWLMWREPAR